LKISLKYGNIEHINELSELFSHEITEGKNKVDFKKWFYKRLLEKHDHGALSALMLCNLDWKIQDNIINEAALAIALHSWKRESDITSDENFNLDKLAVENFPLSFFLSFCDTSQEWGRGVLLESMKNKDISFDISGIEARLESVQVDQSKTKVTIKYLAQKKDPVTDNKNLEGKFKEIGDDFEFTWYSKCKKTTTFEIAGKDNDEIDIGGFATRYSSN